MSFSTVHYSRSQLQALLGEDTPALEAYVDVRPDYTTLSPTISHTSESVDTNPDVFDHDTLIEDAKRTVKEQRLRGGCWADPYRKFEVTLGRWRFCLTDGTSFEALCHYNPDTDMVRVACERAETFTMRGMLQQPSMSRRHHLKTLDLWPVRKALVELFESEGQLESVTWEEFE